jgi:hypothetical protein
MLKNLVFPYTFHIETICNSSMTNEFFNRINLCSNTQVVSCGCSLLKHIYVCVFLYSIFIYIFYILFLHVNTFHS